jgi:pimeloyl-ACP methyl ester carboxylesterase
MPGKNDNADSSTPHPTDTEPVVLAQHDWFYAGGEYVERDGETYFENAMYVERYVPGEVTQPYPVVMFHGGGQTGTNFTATPDGRRGWLHDFLRAGYPVYVIDQPERGRSGHALGVIGSAALSRYPVSRTEQRFTAPGHTKLWPQAERHTQWPGSGRRGEPVFDQFCASQIQALPDRRDIERLNQDAGAALLDKIGPSILLTHSQSGPFGWLIADARPNLVKAILALEPNGPPFYEVEFSGGEDWHTYSEEMTRAWGITHIPLTFDPPAPNAGDITPVQEDTADGPDLVRGYLQAGPARQLPNLQGIPILLMSAEASYHATYDHCTSKFLTQAGVEHDAVRLADNGLRGNGHMVMLERNNHEAADLMIDWLADRLG